LKVRRTQSAFDDFAAREPYFAVVTAPRFLRANLTPEHEREFFASGEVLVDRIFAIIEAALVQKFAPVSMLEYGCGVGRLAIPLSRRPGSVTAVDRSGVMSDLAKREAARRGAGHIQFQTPEEFAATSRRFDLVVCYHVLQRLRPGHGLGLIRQLVERISSDGVGVFQWPLNTGVSMGVEITRWARERVPGVNDVMNRLRGKPATDPFIPTHAYALRRVLDVLKSADCRDTHVVFERAEDLDYAIVLTRKTGVRTHVVRQPAEPMTRAEPPGSPTRTPAGWGGKRSAAHSASAVASEAEIDEFNRAAEAYYATLPNWDHHLAKPFSQIAETPAILANVTVMLQGLELSPGVRVLDFGGGTGWLSRYLTQLGCRVTLLDVSPTALAIARQHYARHPVIGDEPAPEFLLFDGRRIELPDASVDRIVCFDAFHHAANPDAVLREFGRILVPGGLAGFAEPGPRHSESARSCFESSTYGVVERDVDIHAIWRTAQASGFSDLRMCVFHEPAYHVSLAEYEDLVTGGPAQTRWLESTRTFLHLVRDFVLVKAGDVRADSRQSRGLACEIRPATTRATAGAGAALVLEATVTNTGRAYWLPSDAPHGGVSLGAHVYDDEHGTLVNFEAGRVPLGSPPRTIAPNEAVSCRLTISGLAPGRYRVEIDCVAERVTWFAQAGSAPAIVSVEID
jgi:2-polyprenyl-3-methyl-5-hydroxy-6-metoxy-1,4-benzoquinol methylase